ncbi:hypothetical protein fugu_010103 [Takifugu bimaculatus]|uniref:EF-hand domain-containing protein n=1 Tax=Takifugu bimaculatus TaxID=433685 RepID=A0A4Z2CEH9_9TELE|nr:hypothetical protein fugu_010103 [Takifugu bimaculatus]
MARLEAVITNMVDIFMEYADDQGHKRKLCKEELQAMLQKEIESADLKAKINGDDIEEAMKMLDKNKDDEINFREFCRCVGMLATGYYHKKIGKGQKKGKGKDQAGDD